MAYASLNDDEDQQGLRPSLSDNAGQIMTGQGGSGAAPMAGNASAPMQEKGGSQFPDISRYLTQNEPGAERLAAKIGGNVSQAGNQARAGISGLQGGFNQQVAANTVPNDPALTQRAAQNPNSFFNFPQAAPKAAPAPAPTPAPKPQRGNAGNPAAAAAALPYVSRGQPSLQSQVQAPTQPAQIADQSGFNQLQAMRTANYQGPTDLASQSGFAGVNQAAQNAAQMGASTGTDAGRMDLLRNLYGGQVSSPGVAKLDNLLLQGRNPTNTLRGASSSNAGIPGMLAQANTASKGQSQAATAQNAATSKAVNDALQGTYGAFDQDYKGRLKAAEDEAISRVPGHSANPEDKRRLAKLPTNVATEEDYQRLQALNQLMGSNYGL